MNLNYSGLIFVLLVFVEAINGLALDKASNPKDLPVTHSPTDKSHPENPTTETVEVIIANTSENNVKTPDTNTTTTTTSTTTTTTSTTTTTTTTTTPATTTTSAPVTTPAPSPAPEKGKWVVRDSENKTVCIIAEMVMQLNITYPGKNKIPVSAVVNVPKNSNSSGSCSDPSQSLIIEWGPKHSLHINFKRNETVKNFYVSGMSLHVNATVFNVNNTWTFENKSIEFLTPLDMSYKCSRAQQINLTSDDPNLHAVLILRDTQLEAYMNKTKIEFGSAQDCDTFDTPDIVPIAVGCALAILVIVVLVAYLIGRKRSLNRGYLSM